jgi:hypothetical protein
MPQFFFNLMTRDAYVPDEEGRELPDADCACRWAPIWGSQAVPDDLRGRPDLMVEVTDDWDCTIARLPLK